MGNEYMLKDEYIQILSMLKNEHQSLFNRAANSKDGHLYYNLHDHKDLKILASFYNLGKKTIKGFNHEILEEAMAISEQHMEPRNLNDFYSILLLATKSIKYPKKDSLLGIKKEAYPQLPLIVSDDYDDEFDLTKWSKLVYKIYDAVLSKDMTLTNAIDYYSDTLDKKSQEDFKFKKWITHHLSGDNNKYAEEEVEMKKKSDYQFGLNGSSFYYPDNIPVPEKEEPFSVEKSLQNDIDDADSKQKFSEWKNKIDAAVRRIDKLIRIMPNQEISEDLFNALHNFNMTIQKAKSRVTASDISIRTANSFKKMGFAKGHDILVSTAQEVSGDFSPEDEVAGLAPSPDEAPANLESEFSQEPVAPDAGVSEDPVKRVYENTSGAKPGEYEQLEGDISLGDAIGKLEEVAARLSDRRVIRLLAEFDIMLDKIGIASMFPELAESQSKLIDSYSYALVRVTKMLGMLSSGKSLGEISDARKEEITSNIRKDVDKTMNPPEEEAPRGEEVIQDEFEEPRPLTQPNRDIPVPNVEE